MDLLSLTLALFGAFLLLLQAGFCFFNSARPISIGFLNFSLAVLVVFDVYALYTGSVVLAPEFGVILLHGAGTILLFRLALILFAILPALGWYRIRKLNGWTSRIVVSVLAGSVFGVWAAFHVHRINSTDAESLQVFYYDVWFPPLMVWFVVAFSAMVMAIVDIRRKLSCVSFTAAILTTLSSFALRYPDLPDNYSHPLWHFLERFCFGLSLFILVYIATEHLSWKWRGPALGVASLLGVFFGFYHLGHSARAAIGTIPLALWLIAWLAIVFSAFLPASDDKAKERSQVSTAVSFASMPFSMHRVRGTLVALSLPALFVIVIDLYSFSIAPRWLDTAALLMIWLFFAERLAEGALTWLPKLVEGGVLQLRRVKAAASFLRGVFLSILSGFSAVAKFFKSGGSWAVTAKLLLLPIAYLMLIAVATELFNYKKIVIRDFGCTGCAKDNGEEQTRGFVTALTNELGQLRADLLPDAIITQRSSGKDMKDIHMLSAGTDSSAMQSVVAKSEDIQISGLKVPMKIFVDPIQDFVRRFLDIRTIEGSLRFESAEPAKSEKSEAVEKASAGLTIFANSSTGESWRVSSATDADPANLACPVDIPADPVMKLVRHLAFEIAKDDPSFRDVGFTSNYEALLYFRRGLKLWRAQEVNPLDFTSLHSAEFCFQEAVKSDRNFAAAQYRLGLALQRLLHADAAIAAFRDTFDANPKFLSGKILEAVTLDAYSAYSPQPTAVLNIREIGAKDQKDKAFRIWTELTGLPPSELSVSERRSVNFAVCQHYLDAMDDAAHPQSAYLPYFYCSRVIQFLQGLPSSFLADSRERTLEGNALNSLGIAVEIHRREDHQIPLQDPARGLPWTCSSDWIWTDDIDDSGNLVKESQYHIAGSKYSRSAVAYFRQAQLLIPNDTILQCNLASAQLYLDREDSAPMKLLSFNSQVHVDLGAAYEGKLWTVPVPSDGPSAHDLGLFTHYSENSLKEYEKAIELEPDFMDALNGYAYSYWQWRLASLETSVIPPPPEHYGFTAEKYARRQVQIARQRGRSDYLNNAVDTLAEVLLSEGRFSEAAEDASQALTNIDANMLNGTDEVRWDAAQARLCAAVNLSDPALRRANYEAGAKLLQDIRRREGVVEPRLYLDVSEVLDPLRRSTVCPATPDKGVPPSAEQFRAEKPVYFEGNSCSWAGVTVALRGDPPTDDVFLHVWGGGVDELLNLNYAKQSSIVLNATGEALPSEGTNSLFFARLEDVEKSPLSRTISFSTPKDVAKPPCKSNGIRLVFDRVAPRAAHSSTAAKH